MGEVLALISGMFFALGVIFFGLGQATRPNDTGVFMSVAVSIGLYVLLTAAALPFGLVPPPTVPGVIFFLVAGLTNTLIGRWTWLQSVRYIGPSRATSLKVVNPVFASVLAFAVLGQSLTAPTIVGILAVVIGVLVLQQEGEAKPQGGASVVATGVGAAVLVAPGRVGLLTGPYARGIALGLLSALAYGSGAVFRRLGLDTTPSPLLGGLLGSMVALGAILAGDVARGTAAQRWSDNFAHIPRLFVVGAVCMFVGQITSFASLLYTSVALSTTIQSTQPMVAALISVLFFRKLDRLTRRSVAGMLSICAGIAFALLL